MRMDTPSPFRLDLGRALSALNRDWITPEQFRAILHCEPGDGSRLEEWQREGVLDASQLAELYGSTVLLADKEGIERMESARIAEQRSHEPLKKGDWIAARYRILEIFKGGFGRVYLCEAKTEERYSRGNSLVALKTLLRKHLASQEALDLFYSEAAHWISLGSHPNIVLAYGVEEHQRLPFLVMECIEGARSLHQEIHEGRMNWLRGLWVALDVARGLAFAEKTLGLVHGDLKPLNLMLTPEGTVKITDFGLSVRRQTGGAGDETVMAGTPGFMAPEMYLESPGRTPSTDVYAFGVTIFESVTGRRPFPDDEPWLNRTESPTDPRKHAPDLPGAFAEFILSCLDSQPRKRPADFQTISGDLERLHQSLIGSAPPPAHEPDAPARTDALVNRSVSWLNLGRLEEAGMAAREALRISDDHWKAHCTLGIVQMKQGDLAGALASFETAHACSRSQVPPMVNAALASHESGDGERADHWLREALQRCRDKGAFAELDPVSHLLVERPTGEDPLHLLDRIVSEDPGAVITWNNRAVLLRRHGRHAEALESADRAIAINPVHAKAWSNRATALAELGRFSDAIRAAEEALGLDPRLAGAYAAKASALAQLDRLAEARRCIVNGLAILPGNPLLLRAEAMFR